MTRPLLFLPLALLAAACAVVPRAAGPQPLFWERLWALCGRAYEGRVVSTDPGDRDMASSRLVMQVTTCTPTAVRIAFHVGADASRTWVIGRTASGFTFTHLHRSRAGTEEARSRYGGATVAPGSARRQDFPADAASRALFRREDIAASAANIWSVEIVPGRSFAYALDREGRHLRIEFDLSHIVSPPGPAWGER
jgi:hypothetical protein